MIRFGKTTMVIAACTLGATAALAQTAGQTTPPATGTAPSTTQTAPSTGTATSASFTDSDVSNFAGAAIAVQKIQQDSSIADTDKQTKMASAVSSSGLTPDKFNAIAQASQSDPALMKRIQTAAAAKMQASPNAAPGASGSAGGMSGGTAGSASGGMSGSTGQ
jgi:hypothetical protein